MEETNYTANDMLAQVRESLAALKQQRMQIQEALEQAREQVAGDERQAKALAVRIELAKLDIEALQRSLLQLDGVLEYARGQESGWSSVIERAENGKENRDAAEGQDSA